MSAVGLTFVHRTMHEVKDSADAARREVSSYVASLGDPNVTEDCLVLIDLMQRISGEAPELWNVGTLGFGRYRYHYASGRRGESHTIGFYPRKGKITFYLMDGTIRYTELLEKLGRHTTSKVCIYIRRLDDIDIPVLEEILTLSFQYVSSRDGTMHRAEG